MNFDTTCCFTDLGFSHFIVKSEWNFCCQVTKIFTCTKLIFIQSIFLLSPRFATLQFKKNKNRKIIDTRTKKQKYGSLRFEIWKHRLTLEPLFAKLTRIRTGFQVVILPCSPLMSVGGVKVLARGSLN